MPPFRRDLPPITTQQNQRERQEAAPALPLPELPPVPVPSTIQPDPLDQELTLETQNINEAIPVGQEEEPTFARELEETTTQDDELFTAMEQLQAPPVYDALQEAQRLYDEAGIQSLNDQLSVLDSEIGTFDADVRGAIATTRNRLAPLDIINAETQQLQRNADERRGALLRERQFIQSQIVSRTNLVNSLVQLGQQTYQNELAAYNAGVDRFIRLYELQQNVQLRNIEIAQRQQAFNQAQADYVMDRIAQAVAAGVTFDQIPTSLTDALTPLSESLYGNAEFLPEMVEFLANSGALVGETGDRTNFFPLGTLVDDDGNVSGMLLYDRATGRNIVVSPPEGFNILPNQSGNNVSVIGGGYRVDENGNVTYTGIDRRTGEEVSFPSDLEPEQVSNDRTNRNILQDLSGVSIPSQVTEMLATNIISEINSDPTYRDESQREGARARERARQRAQQIYEDYLIRNIYQDVFTNEDIISSIGTGRGERQLFQSPTGQIEVRFGDANDIGQFLRYEILRNTGTYRSATDVIQDIEARPNIWISAYNNWKRIAQPEERPVTTTTTTRAEENRDILDRAEQQRQTQNQVRGETQTRGQIDELIENSQPASGTREQVNISTGATVPISRAVERHRSAVSQAFPSYVVNDVLAIMEGESEGNRTALRNVGNEYSVGLMQINIGDSAVAELVRGLMGNANATRTQMRTWLNNEENNLSAAREIYDETGDFRRWTVGVRLGLGG
ncbi:MAG: hypothetical protein F4X82_01790 [Candidatus Spechtbacteria bacterium SB0662_bin_43]|uniref:Transglycosylase SLT domain-containing protein n=1 Tax=Candidatus Spechtbacteria bacterium SB0662_bin_43 TaxID=2604897 RepID=A0A845DC50_9BACT|nr:hypothetical protein [Candidatus Spechtbacteria bacterium SB0662_bin_43]